MADKDQVMRYNNQELETIKITFNEDTLFLLRKFFLCGKLTVDEQKALTIFKDNQPAVEVLRKELLPVIDTEAPLFQLMDMYLTIETRGKHPDEVFVELKIRDVLVDYFEQKFTELTTNITSTITLQSLLFDTNAEPEKRVTNLGARNLIIFHIESHLNDFKVLANKKEETKEEREEREKKDSAE